MLFVTRIRCHFQTACGQSLRGSQIRFNFDKQYIALPPIEYLSYDAEDLYKKGNIG